MRVDPVELAVVLAALAPPGIVTGARLITPDDLGGLRVEERAAVANAVPGRRHEFASGRTLLRELLGTSEAILVGPTRAPRLPAGVVGSLAHDRALVVAAVSHDPTVSALGIDIEPTDLLTSDMARVILRDDERDVDAHLAFTLKEAAYKAWSTGPEAAMTAVIASGVRALPACRSTLSAAQIDAVVAHTRNDLQQP